MRLGMLLRQLCEDNLATLQSGTESSLRESIPILSTGISLHLLLPSAFVALPAAAVQELSPRARLRVISGGPFHNFILWVFLGIISWSGIGSPLLSVIGYKNIGHYGRVVVHVSAVRLQSISYPTLVFIFLTFRTLHFMLTFLSVRLLPS